MLTIPDSLTTFGVPEHLHEGLALYVEHHVLPGSFLSAVLRNDLLGACSRGDPESLAGLANIVKWLYNEAPAGCWGDEDRVEAWTARRVVE